MTRYSGPCPAIGVRDLVVKGQDGFTLDIRELDIAPGSMVALIGRNGSGKSTFLDAALSLLDVNSGKVQIFGETLAKLPTTHPVRARIGAQVQGVTWSWSIKVGEIMAIHNSLYGSTYAKIVDGLGVRSLFPGMYRKLSTGQRRRVDLAMALAHKPDLIILDEPSSGLDRQYRTAFHEILAERRAAGATILIASHEGRDVGMADRILWFEKGEIIEDSAPGDIIGRRVGHFVGIVDDAAPTLLDRLENDLAPSARSHARDGSKLVLIGENDLRTPFIAAMERHSVAGYVVRPARSSDLLDLVRNSEQFDGGRP
ncbi:ATP-binding cassette domain-containing protein [Sphingomonas qomolangmaensis]|uniref:ABC transporter ATP-binding protein n=1 Tax=Sphingomonas qomolangmaensis TaxID=2918765 RepID=A0ABY5L9M9_9SPHN|nr:ABC transporter ATP-binding protein [Sphingomonas qomolangmaensis]UUL82504.1 ABC transporter ATP-binding protein [Sphingomonas qomolangmaensis]